MPIQGIGMQAFPRSLPLGLKRSWPGGMFSHVCVLYQPAAVPVAYTGLLTACIFSALNTASEALMGGQGEQITSCFSSVASSMAPFDRSSVTMLWLLLTKTQRSGSLTEQMEGQPGGTGHGVRLPSTGEGLNCGVSVKSFLGGKNLPLVLQMEMSSSGASLFINHSFQ